MDRTIISRNNAFLVSVGITGGGRAKAITEKGQKLANALEHQLAQEISFSWREVIASNEFLQKMISAVSIRQGMEDSALQSHIAYSAGEGRNTRVMAGAGAVVEILKIAGVVKEQDGKIIAVPDVVQQLSSPSLREALKEPESVTPPAHVQLTPQIAIAQTHPGISIQIQIQCSANDLDTLGPKLRALIKDLTKKEEQETEGTE